MTESHKIAGDGPLVPSGADLADAIEAAARAKNVSAGAFIAPLTRHSTNFLHQLRAAKKPKPITVARVRALLAGEPIPPGRPHAAGVVYCRREERAERGLGPSGREIRDATVLDHQASERAKIAQLRDVAETRHSERTQNIQAIVEREAAESGRRRGEARKLSGVAHPLPLAFPPEERRARELEELESASSVLRRAQRDWPEQCAAVKVLADLLGVALGEAWRRVISAGVLCLREDEYEEGGGSMPAPSTPTGGG